MRKFNNDRRIGFLSVRRKLCGRAGLEEATKKRLVEDEARRNVRRTVTVAFDVQAHVRDYSRGDWTLHVVGTYIFVHSFSRTGTHTP